MPNPLVINTKKLSTCLRIRKRPKLQKTEALTPKLSTKTRIFMDGQHEIVPPSMKTPVSVDGILKTALRPRNRPFSWTEGGNMYGDTFYRR